MRPMPRTILVVDDEPTILDTLAYNLERDGYAVVTAADGAQALTAFRRDAPDLIILDLMLPELSGHGGLPHHPARVTGPHPDAHRPRLGDRQGRRPRARRRRLRDQALQPARAAGPRPSAAAADGDRRSPAPSQPATVGPGRGRRSTWPATDSCATGTSCRVKPKAFELLAFLLRHPGQAFTRDQLLEQVWGYDYAGETRTVDVHVHWLRAQVEADPSRPRFLHTVRGVGYVFRRPGD